MVKGEAMHSEDGARYARLTGPISDPDEDWYDSVGLALYIIGKRWYSDTTLDEDAFILAFADEVSQRPAHEQPCAPCSKYRGQEVVHGILECPTRLGNGHG